MDQQTYSPGTPPPPVPPPPAAPPGPPAEPLNPWFAIWVMPRPTMRQILDTDPRRLVHVLAAAGGAVKWAQLNIPSQLVDMTSFSLILGLKLGLAFGGAIVGLISLYLFGFLVRLTGGWLGGKGDFTAVRSAVAWSNIPAIWGLLLWLPTIAFLGPKGINFDPGTLIHEPGGAMLVVPVLLMTIVLGIWQLVVFLKCAGEAHGFSAWRALGATLLSLLIVGAVMAVPAGIAAALFVSYLAR
jgi:hypothetical protein